MADAGTERFMRLVLEKIHCDQKNDIGIGGNDEIYCRLHVSHQGQETEVRHPGERKWWSFGEGTEMALNYMLHQGPLRGSMTVRILVMEDDAPTEDDYIGEIGLNLPGGEWSTGANTIDRGFSSTGSRVFQLTGSNTDYHFWIRAEVF